MNDQPLGDPTGPTPAVDIELPSIVDTILNLDEFLSGDIRRAEKTARICTRPDLEADIDDLEAELAGLVDDRGNPLTVEESLGEGNGRTAQTVALEIRDKQREMAASMRSIRLRQLPEDKWAVFHEKHLKDLGDDGVTNAAWDELIVACAIAPTITPEQLKQMRERLGHPAIDVIATKAWNVNTKAGVSIPKSLTSSVVLKRMQLLQS
jgi:hypothetical protein